MDDYILRINGLLQHMDLMDKFVEFRINYPGPADR